MSARSEKPKNRKVKVVGGGYRWTRQPNAKLGGSMKAERRRLRKLEKARKSRKGKRA